MPKPAKLQKHIVINIVVLAVGVVIGLAFKKTQTPAARAAECETSASLVTDPAAARLGAPIFKEPGTIYSSKDGLILVRWNDVNGATTYQVRVWDEQGAQLKNFTTKRSFTFLKNLPVDPATKETPYWVMVTPLDDQQTRGQDSERKEVAMLPLRNLDPPTIKSIQTEAEELPKTETK